MVAELGPLFHKTSYKISGVERPNEAVCLGWRRGKRTTEAKNGQLIRNPQAETPGRVAKIGSD